MASSRLRAFALAFIGFAASGCAIEEAYRPLSGMPDDAQLCIIGTPAVRAEFLAAYESALAAKGVAYTVVSHGEDSTDCEWSSRYEARWAWDIAEYLAFARILLFQGDSLAGGALYDVAGGGLNLTKFNPTDATVDRLVEELFSSR